MVAPKFQNKKNPNGYDADSYWTIEAACLATQPAYDNLFSQRFMDQTVNSAFEISRYQRWTSYYKGKYADSEKDCLVMWL